MAMEAMLFPVSAQLAAAPVASNGNLRGVLLAAAKPQPETLSRGRFATAVGAAALAAASMSTSRKNRRLPKTARCSTSEDSAKLDGIKGMSFLGDSSADFGVEKLPTGALGLDIALGGGLAKGRIIEVFGPEASGKTSISLMALAAAQKAGELAVFIDAEHALDPIWAEKIGVDIGNLRFYQPESGEDALDKVIEVLEARLPGLIVVDSVSQLTPAEELEKGMDKSTMGLQARMMSKAMRKIPGLAREANCTVIFINQIRMKIGVMYGSPETRSGGQALKYAASQILDVRRKDWIKGPGDTTIGNKLNVKVVKNKVAPPHRSAMLEISYETGIKRMASMVEAASTLGLINRKGAFYYYGETKLGQGMDKTLAELEENETIREEIEGLVRSATLPGVEDEEPKVPAEGPGIEAEGPEEPSSPKAKKASKAKASKAKDSKAKASKAKPKKKVTA